MNAGQVSDYASKVTGTTTDLNVFEASLDKYIAEIAMRDLQGEERGKVQTKLIGLEAVYEKYKLWKTLLTTSSGLAGAGRYGGGAGAGIVTAREAEKERQELETQLQAHDFKGIDDFKVWIKKYEKAFEQEAANIAKDVLAKLAGKLYGESERYKDPLKVADLHQKLGGFRTSYAEFEANAKISNEYAEQRATRAGTAPRRGAPASQDHLK